MQVRPLTVADAEEIAPWRYPGRLAVYDVGEPVSSEVGYRAVEREGGLAGYCCFGAEARVAGVQGQQGTLDVGYGMHPDLMGNGLGRGFVAAILDAGVAEFEPNHLRLLILDWNRRSRRVAEALGFLPESTTSNDRGTFVVMKRRAR